MMSGADTEARFRAAGAREEDFRADRDRDGDTRGRPRGREKEEKPPPPPLDPIDPTKWTGPAPARRWIVPEWVPRGVVTGFSGIGGIGKSLLAQQLLTSTSAGAPWLDLAVNQGRTLGVFCEDDPDELQRRQEAINASMGLAMADLGSMRLLSRVGDDNSLVRFDHGGADLTVFHDQLRELCATWKPDLLVLDTAADLYPDNESDRGKVRWFIQTGLASLARAHNCGLVLLSHPSLTGIASGEGTSGSTAWSNTVRSRFYLEKESGQDADPNVRVLSRKKANYAALGGDLRLTWEEGILVPAGAPKPSASMPWETITKIFDEIDRAWKAGNPWSNNWQSKPKGRYLPDWVRTHCGVQDRQLKPLITAWQMHGCLATEMVDLKTKLSGLKVIKRPDSEIDRRSKAEQQS